MNANKRKILEDAGVLYPTAVSNADRIRAMTDEELAKNISKLVRCPRCPIHKMCLSNYSTASCDEIICEWLKQESEEEIG